MNTKSIVVLQDNIESISEIVSAIGAHKDFNVVASTQDGEEGISLIRQLKPDFVIMGIILKNADGFEVLEKIKNEEIKTMVIVVSSFTNESIIRRALSSGAVYYMAKPFKAETLAERLTELSSGLTYESDNQLSFKRKNTLDEKISKIFISVGIPPHIKGYQYLREGVKMAVESPDIINNITKQLYPKIGQKYQTSASKVERAIRHAIEVAWNRGRIETINSLLGIRAYIGNDKPTNGEFIALIADKMLLEGA